MADVRFEVHRHSAFEGACAPLKPRAGRRLVAQQHGLGAMRLLFGDRVAISGLQRR